MNEYTVHVQTTAVLCTLCTPNPIRDSVKPILFLSTYRLLLRLVYSGQPKAAQKIIRAQVLHSLAFIVIVKSENID